MPLYTICLSILMVVFDLYMMCTERKIQTLFSTD